MAYENNVPFASEIYVLTLLVMTGAKLQLEKKEDVAIRSWVSCADPDKVNGLLFFSICPRTAESLLKKGDVVEVSKSPFYLEVTTQGFVRSLSQFSSIKHPT